MNQGNQSGYACVIAERKLLRLQIIFCEEIRIVADVINARGHQKPKEFTEKEKQDFTQFGLI